MKLLGNRQIISKTRTNFTAYQHHLTLFFVIVELSKFVIVFICSLVILFAWFLRSCYQNFCLFHCFWIFKNLAIIVSFNIIYLVLFFTVSTHLSSSLLTPPLMSASISISPSIFQYLLPFFFSLILLYYFLSSFIYSFSFFALTLFFTLLNFP